MPDKLPQNVVSLVGSIGEQQVLLRLATLAHKRPHWEVFKNLGESGYDVLLTNTISAERICIEVKTRQKIYTTAKNPKNIQFNLTAGEYKSSDFLVAYFLDQDDFYIVPKQDLKSISGGRKWRFQFTLGRTGEPPQTVEKYRNSWNLLHTDFTLE